MQARVRVAQAFEEVHYIELTLRIVIYFRETSRSRIGKGEHREGEKEPESAAFKDVRWVLICL